MAGWDEGDGSLLRLALLVDDSLPWQRFVLTYFETKTEFKVITIAPDGFEAVQKANELRPEVILMDVNLPGMNGIETARQIRGLSPGSKILFLSMHADSEIVQAAFDAGGLGYLLKLDFNRDLIPAIRTIVLGSAVCQPQFDGFTRIK